MTETNENDGRTYAVAQALADNAVAEVLASGAENYLECHFGFTVEGEETERPIVVTMQFADRPSPHELRLVAENQRDRLAKLLVQLLRATGADLRDASLEAGPDLCAVAMDHVARLQASAQGIAINYASLHEYACSVGVDYNNLCAAVRAALAQPSPAPELMPDDPRGDFRGWFEGWALENEHPVFGWLGADWLDQGDEPNTYGKEYIQGAWVMAMHLSGEFERLKFLCHLHLSRAKVAEQERDAAQARVAELERVLAPFAEVADAYDPAEDDSFQPWKDAPAVDVLRLTLGQHRAAKAALRSAAPVAQAGQVPEVSGIGRDAEHPRAVVLYLRKEPTDDDLRAIQGGLRSLAAAPAQGGGKEQGDDPAP